MPLKEEKVFEMEKKNRLLREEFIDISTENSVVSDDIHNLICGLAFDNSGTKIERYYKYDSKGNPSSQRASTILAGFT